MQRPLGGRVVWLASLSRMKSSYCSTEWWKVTMGTGGIAEVIQ